MSVCFFGGLHRRNKGWLLCRDRQRSLRWNKKPLSCSLKLLRKIKPVNPLQWSFGCDVWVLPPIVGRLDAITNAMEAIGRFTLCQWNAVLNLSGWPPRCWVGYGRRSFGAARQFAPSNVLKIFELNWNSWNRRDHFDGYDLFVCRWNEGYILLSFRISDSCSYIVSCVQT